MEAIILTVGISTVRNYNATHDEKTPFATPEGEDLYRFVSENPDRASAELNTLSKLEIDPDQAHVFPLISDTLNGAIAGTVISRYIREHYGTAVTEKYLTHLEDNPRQFVEIGMHQFTNTLMRIIQQYQREARILSTGGFKAQMAYALFVGILTGVPVYYMHEKFHNIIELPGLPVSFDTREYRKMAAQIQQILRAETNHEARKIIDTLPMPWQAMFQKKPEGNGYEFSAAGVALHQTYQQSTSGDGSTPPTPPIQSSDASTHTTIWGKGVTDWDALPREQRALLQTLARHCPGINTVKIGPRSDKRRDIPTLVFHRAKRPILTFEFSVPEGTQLISFAIDPGSWYAARQYLEENGFRRQGDAQAWKG